MEAATEKRRAAEVSPVNQAKRKRTERLTSTRNSTPTDPRKGRGNNLSEALEALDNFAASQATDIKTLKEGVQAIAVILRQLVLSNTQEHHPTSSSAAAAVQREATDETSWSQVTRGWRQPVKQGPVRPEEGSTAVATPRPPREKTRRAQAVIIQVKQGATFADTLKSVKASVGKEIAAQCITGTKMTRNGAVLVELKAGADANQVAEKAREGNLVEQGAVRCTSDRKVTIEILDVELDCSDEEVLTAVRTVVDEPDIEVRPGRPGIFGSRIYSVRLPEAPALALAGAGSVHIGWSSCKLRVRQTVEPCSRCHDYGHRAQGCLKEDRSLRCRACDGKEHKAWTCKAPPQCRQCEQEGRDPKHYPGSGQCKPATDARKADRAQVAAAEDRQPQEEGNKAQQT